MAQSLSQLRSDPSSVPSRNCSSSASNRLSISPFRANRSSISPLRASRGINMCKYVDILIFRCFNIFRFYSHVPSMYPINMFVSLQSYLWKLDVLPRPSFAGSVASRPFIDTSSAGMSTSMGMKSPPPPTRSPPAVPARSQSPYGSRNEQSFRIKSRNEKSPYNMPSRNQQSPNGIRSQQSQFTSQYGSETEQSPYESKSDVNIYPGKTFQTFSQSQQGWQ